MTINNPNKKNMSEIYEELYISRYKTQQENKERYFQLKETISEKEAEEIINNFPDFLKREVFISLERYNFVLLGNSTTSFALDYSKMTYETLSKKPYFDKTLKANPWVTIAITELTMSYRMKPKMEQLKKINEEIFSDFETFFKINKICEHPSVERMRQKPKEVKPELSEKLETTTETINSNQERVKPKENLKKIKNF